MNEILAGIKLKDKVIIISVMAVFALLLGFGIGAITQATVDPHVHSYESHLEKDEEGNFSLVSVCTDEDCEDPVYTVAVDGVDRVELSAATCCEKGLVEYSYRHNGIVYFIKEELPLKPHAYDGVLVDKDGGTVISAKCTNEGCNDTDLTLGDVSSLTLVDSTPATCHTPRLDRYEYVSNGVSTILVVRVEEDVPHILNGAYATESQLPDGSFSYGTNGIKLDKDTTVTCGTSGSGYFICEECKEQISVQVVKDDHNFVWIEEETVLPTAIASGTAIVRCQNLDCKEAKSILLPMVSEGEHAELLEANHAEKYKKLKYSFISDEYGINVQFEIQIVWDEHDYRYIDSETVKPTETRNGWATVECSYDGCTAKRKTISLPKIVIGENAEIVSEVSELNPLIVRYNYVSDTYGFTVSFDHVIGSALEHDYTYELVREGDGFVLIGRCHQLGCQTPETRDTDLAITHVNTSTCYSLGEDIWSCEHDGVTYTYKQPATEYAQHNLSYSESETVAPTFDASGVAYVRCTNEGCTTHHKINLPKVVVGDNAIVTFTDPDTGAKTVRYIYTNPTYGLNIELDLTVSAHVHSYRYVLEPHAGHYDLIGTCGGWDCDAPSVREEDVEVSFRNTSTCQTAGEQIWSHVKDGVTYSFSLPAFDTVAHKYAYDEETLVRPTLDADGSALMCCIYAGCDECLEVVLPKITIGENSTVISTDSESGITIVSYTYISTSPKFTVELELEITGHIHNYEYTLEPGSNGFDLVGICNEPDCDAPTVREENVDTSYENTSTCITLGEEIFSVVKNGKTVTFTLPAMEYAPHSLTYDANSIVNPTLDSDGSLLAYCTVGGCTHTEDRALPKLAVGDNCEMLSYDEQTGVRVFRYTYNKDGLSLEIEFSLIDNHTHEFVTTLEPHEGKFDLISRCSNPLCTQEYRDVAVAAVLVEDTTGCNQAGYQIWEYEKDGVTYQCTIIISVFFGHSMAYQVEASTTVKPTFSTAGSIVVYCKGCDEATRVVELPVAVIGENAIFLEETQQEIVYLYSYVTEDDISINLFLTVSK